MKQDRERGLSIVDLAALAQLRARRSQAARAYWDRKRDELRAAKSHEGYAEREESGQLRLEGSGGRCG